MVSLRVQVPRAGVLPEPRYLQTLFFRVPDCHNQSVCVCVCVCACLCVCEDLTEILPAYIGLIQGVMRDPMM